MDTGYLIGLRPLIPFGPRVDLYTFNQLRADRFRANRAIFQAAMPAKSDHPGVRPGTDLLSRIIERPFETWQSTLLSLAFVVAFAGVIFFLSRRYIEVVTFNAYSCCNPPRSLEGQRTKSRNPGHNGKACWEEKSSAADTDFDDEDGTGIRRRTRPLYVQPSIVAIGDVHAGRIAQRRASSSRIVSAEADELL
ncbi:hypothetical protein LTS07_001360 [Exophiala sideris]|uniref:Uncharacterized protein n=1 Tax=Exophiala sideris TaxID=1016849 RepID=A0ABR0JN08_9EURO|nr:hypothetical protein LTS07_001360 [Exophiala sideris]KAK5043876.1 hypothetical protein LTR13_000230 [Exophiala sideris]KAK5067375.1 hypothetical protein LTR69_001362 [Exophiala sideris]KAK5182708.1 hypothetical protein LTR44_005099 [Eurotiomycetes sp. CCFEE 6388]